MKNINTKKVVAGVAALGLSALLAGSVVAANVGGDNFSMDLTKDTMYNNGVPAVSVIVGSMAQPVDVVWAGNIAAAIGKKAYTTTTASGGAASLESVTVEVGSSSTSTISGDGKLTDDWELGTETTEVIDEDDYSLLDDYDVSVDEDEFGEDEINVKDSLSVKATVDFDSDKDVADLTATINKKDISYNVEFNPAIADAATDDGSPDFKFNLMGKQYTLEEWDGTTLTLVQNKATVPYTVGQTFELEGYTIEVIEILEKSSQGTDYEVEMSISQDGSVLATEVYADGDTIFDDYLNIDTEIDTVYNSRVTIVSGTSARIELKHGTVIDDFPNIGDELWYSDFTKSGDDLVSIEIYNNDNDVQWKDEDALRVGDSIELPNGFAKIEFLGLTTESSKTLTVEDNVLSWTDSADDDHEIFMYEEETGTYEDGDTYTTTNEIDGKQLFITFHTVDVAQATAATYANIGDINYAAQGAEGYVTIQLEDEDGKYLTADATTPTEFTWETTNTALSKLAYGDDGVDVAKFYNIEIPLYNNEDVSIAYGLFIKEANATNIISQIALGLKDGATSNIESTTQKWTVNKIYYQIDVDDSSADTYVGATNAGATTVAEEDMTSMFELLVQDEAGSTISVYIDAYTGDLVNTDDTDYLAAINQVESAFANLNQEDSDDLTWAYTDFGTKFMVEGGMFEAVIPEAQLYGQIFIGGGSSSETTLNGGELVLSTPGTVVSTEDGMVSAKLVSANVTGGLEGEAITPANWNVNTRRLVYLDNESTSVTGPKVIVGGHMVNTLAQGLTNDYLTQAGQFVVGALGNGDVVVAGYTAADTADAAKELITVIENM